MTMPPDPPRLRLRVVFDAVGMLGPGKAELLEHIDKTGSIAAAGREMGMSYKRAWQLVEEVNAMFRAPLVHSSRGGVKGGGAQLSDTGRAVLDAYRAAEQNAREAGREPIARLQSLLRDMSDGK